MGFARLINRKTERNKLIYLMIESGAGEANTDEHLRCTKYHHDIIEFYYDFLKSHFDEFRRLYLKGLSLGDISARTAIPISTIRDELVANKIPLRLNKKANELENNTPRRAYWGAIPFGYTLLDGKLVVDPKELKVVRKILAFHQNKISFNAIAKKLTEQKIPSKTGRRWNDKTVARIIRRTSLNDETEMIRGLYGND